MVSFARLCYPTLSPSFPIVARHTSFQSNEEHFRPIPGTIAALIQGREESPLLRTLLCLTCVFRVLLFVVFAIVVDNTPVCYVKDLCLGCRRIAIERQ